MADTNYIVSSKIANVKNVSSTPANFRLARKQDGTIILQGAFVCSEGLLKTSSWLEWKDLDTVDHETSLPLVESSAPKVKGVDGGIAMPTSFVKDLTDVCPECGRKKAHSADDCASGLCPKWYAIRDTEAKADCEKVAQKNTQPISITDTDRLNYVFSLNCVPSKELTEIEFALLNGNEVDMKVVRAAIDASIKAEVQEPNSNETLYSVNDGDYIIYDGKTLAECRAFIVSEIEDALAIYDELAFYGTLEPVSRVHLFDVISKLDENSVHDLHVNDAITGGQYARAFAITKHGN